MIPGRDHKDPLVFLQFAQHLDVAAEPTHGAARWGVPRGLSLGFYLALLSLLSGTQNFVVWPPSLPAEVRKVLVTLCFFPQGVERLRWSRQPSALRRRRRWRLNGSILRSVRQAWTNSWYAIRIVWGVVFQLFLKYFFAKCLKTFLEVG